MKINEKKLIGSAGYMKAQDMFITGAKQVFCRKTGIYMRLERKGQESPDMFDLDEEEKQDEPEQKDKNQLSLF